MRRAIRDVPASLALIALFALAGCQTGLDITPPAPEAGTPTLVPSGLAVGPRATIAGGPSPGIARAAGSDGRGWLIAGSAPGVGSAALYTRDAAGAFGPVWHPPADSPGVLEIAGTSAGYLFVAQGAGLLHLVRALDDSTVLDSTVVADASAAGFGRVASGGDAAWLAIMRRDTSYPVFRVFRISVDARGHQVTDTLCDGCANPDDSLGYPWFAFAGNADGAVLGWHDELGLQFRTLRFDAGASPAARAVVGPVFTARDFSHYGSPVVLTVAHGHEVSVAWSAGGDVLRQRIDTRSGAPVTTEPASLGAVGRRNALVPLGSDVLFLTQYTDLSVDAVLFAPEPAPFPWPFACFPTASAAGPSGRTLVVCDPLDAGRTGMSLFDVSHAGAEYVAPPPEQPSWPSATTGAASAALGCDSRGCSIAFGASTAPLAVPSLARGPVVALGPEGSASTAGLAGIVRTGGTAYVATAYDAVMEQPAHIVRIDVGAGAPSGMLDVQALALASGRDPGTILFVEATTGTELRVSRWDRAALTPLSAIATHWTLLPNVALASAPAGLAMAWIERDGRGVSFSYAPSEDAPLSIPQALADGELAKRQVTVAIVGTTALVGWEERSTWAAFELRVAAIDLTSGEVLSITTPLAELGELMHRIVSVGEIALLAWQRPDSSLGLARLDATGRPLDPTDSRAFTVAGRCTPFGLATVDASQAAVWCHDGEILSVRMVFVPESVR